MKVKDIAKQYGIDYNAFLVWMRNSGLQYKSGLSGATIEDNLDVHSMVSDFKLHFSQEQERLAQELADAERQAKEHKAQLARAAKEKQAALASMLITSGFNFDGFTITKYSGYISGDDVVQIDRGQVGFFSKATDVGASLMLSLAHIRRNALAELKEAAYALGCNAVIGVDFDYLTLDPETASTNGGTMYLPYVFGVTANGNAVVIEKNASSAL